MERLSFNSSFLDVPGTVQALDIDGGSAGGSHEGARNTLYMENAIM